jgi:hypothetical protein
VGASAAVADESQLWSCDLRGHSTLWAAASASATARRLAYSRPREHLLGDEHLGDGEQATTFWSKTVRLMVSCTTPVSMATEQLERVMSRVKPEAPCLAAGVLGGQGWCRASPNYDEPD